MGAKVCCPGASNATTDPSNAAPQPASVESNDDFALHASWRLVECSSDAETVVRDTLFRLQPHRVRDKQRQMSPEHDAIFDNLAEMELLKPNQKRGMASLVSTRDGLETKIANLERTIEGIQSNAKMTEDKKAERVEDLRGKKANMAEQLQAVKSAIDQVQELCPSIYASGTAMRKAGHALEKALADPIRKWIAEEYSGMEVNVFYSPELKSRKKNAWRMEYDGIVVGTDDRRLVAVIEIKLARADAQLSVKKRIAAAAEAETGPEAFYFVDENDEAMNVEVSAAGLGNIYAVVNRVDRHANLDSTLFYGMQDEAMTIAALYDDRRLEEASSRAQVLRSRIAENCPQDAAEFTVDGARVVFIDTLMTDSSA